MSDKVFKKGFAEGFLSPFTFFLSPVKKEWEAAEFQEYKSQKLPDIGIAAAWREVGCLLRATVKAEGEKIDSIRGDGNRQRAKAQKRRKIVEPFTG